MIFNKNSLTSLPQRWILTLAIIALIIPVLIIEYQVMTYTRGVFAYPLDDAFIHMGIARNLALHGVWGISPFGFVSASSSILYPPLLAAVFIVTGPHIVIPLMLNLLSGIAILVVMQRWLRRQGLSPLSQLVILLAAIFFIPLPVIISIGMEHTLQILFCFLFIYRFSDWLAAGVQSGQKHWKVSPEVFIYGVLVTATRYEGILLIMVACALLLYYRQWELSLELGIISMLPVIIFGIYAMFNGNFFLPNSVLLKADAIPMTPAGILDFVTHGIFQKLFYDTPTTSAVSIERLLIVLPLTYFVFFQQLRKDLTYRCILIFLMAATFLHMSLANTNWFYRYEAYLPGCAVLVIGSLIAKYGRELFMKKSWPSRWVGIFITLLLFLPFVLRSRDALRDVQGACHNIYDQNYNMGRFLHEYYDTTTVAINDLGCPSYFLSGKLIDLWGLGNIEVAQSKRNNYYGTPFLDSLIRKEKVKIAVVFDRLYNPDLLYKWHKIAIWHIDDRRVSGDANLSFYAVDTLMGPALKKNLMRYQPSLPSGVTVYYSNLQ